MTQIIFDHDIEGLWEASFDCDANSPMEFAHSKYEAYSRLIDAIAKPENHNWLLLNAHKLIEVKMPLNVLDADCKHDWFLGYVNGIHNSQLHGPFNPSYNDILNAGKYPWQPMTSMPDDTTVIAITESDPDRESLQCDAVTTFKIGDDFHFNAPDDSPNPTDFIAWMPIQEPPQNWPNWLPKSANWHSIDTAPMNGTKIDLWTIDPWTNDSGRITNVWWDGAWFRKNDSGEVRQIKTYKWNITHWMPIPDKPKGDEQ